MRLRERERVDLCLVVNLVSECVSEWVGWVCEREWERTTKRESGITRGWMDALGVCLCLCMGEM